jgi:hypothetical protein
VRRGEGGKVRLRMRLPVVVGAGDEWRDTVSGVGMVWVEAGADGYKGRHVFLFEMMGEVEFVTMEPHRSQWHGVCMSIYACKHRALPHYVDATKNATNNDPKSVECTLRELVGRIAHNATNYRAGIQSTEGMSSATPRTRSTSKHALPPSRTTRCKER